MSKKINGAEYELAKIFSSEFEYHIPSYQRPYAWTIDQAQELFEDLYDFYQTGGDEGYFLGSIVLIKTETEPYSEVIDGQQRLTTLTILLASICNLTEGNYQTELKTYIMEPGKESQGLKASPRLTLRERDRSFFKEYVQELNFDKLVKIDPANLNNESQRNIKGNANYFIDALDKKFNGNMDEIKKFVQFLVMRCYLVAVSTPSQQSAFRVFSVMNSRGLDLQPTDIIKADIIGQIANDKQNEYNEKWEDMEVRLTRSGFNDLFSFIRMIYAKVKAKKSLLEEFREHVLQEVKDPIILLENVLEPYADALAIIKNANYQATINADKINSYLRWLNRIDNSDWIPPAIVFLANHRDDPIYIEWFFKKLERLAAYLHVCSKNVNERIERYSSVIKELEGDHSYKSPIKSIELNDDEKSEMKNTLNGNIYEFTPRRRNYIILRLDAFISDGAASYDPAILTIEHVLPQTVSPNSEWEELWPDEVNRHKWVHRIANLVPLNGRANSQAKNYNFDQKKNIYFMGRNNISSFALTSQVLNTSTWSEDFLITRQKKLLDILSTNWELNKTEP